MRGAKQRINMHGVGVALYVYNIWRKKRHRCGLIYVSNIPMKNLWSLPLAILRIYNQRFTLPADSALTFSTGCSDRDLQNFSPFFSISWAHRSNSPSCAAISKNLRPLIYTVFIDSQYWCFWALSLLWGSGVHYSEWS